MTRRSPGIAGGWPPPGVELGGAPPPGSGGRGWMPGPGSEGGPSEGGVKDTNRKSGNRSHAMGAKRATRTPTTKTTRAVLRTIRRRRAAGVRLRDVTVLPTRAPGRS